MEPSSDDVTALLASLRAGDPGAAEKLTPVVYKELRRIAASYMRSERPDHTLQATALVNEAYLRLVRLSVDWQDKAHFMAVASTVMRRILVDHARERVAAKRGGHAAKIELDEQVPSVFKSFEEVLSVDQALSSLAEISPRQARVVELLCFGSLSINEAAAVIGMDASTVKRDWSTARLWLRRRLRSEAAPEPDRLRPAK
ncbi:MAG TPA: ECF-type sigma factor [Bryobacteraceae bacterium]|nr:ECF-type sigma factor [Bryobacteraceae bacterium]